jgi:hypothetical protein
MKKSTREVAAKKVAKRPQVKAEIERLTLELLPPVQDMRASYHHAFSTILKVTMESPDDRLRFDAARWLLAECERRGQLSERQEQRAEKAAPEGTEAVIAELRALYAKAGLRPRDTEAPLVVEVDAGERSGGNCRSAARAELVCVGSRGGGNSGGRRWSRRARNTPRFAGKRTDVSSRADTWPFSSAVRTSPNPIIADGGSSAASAAHASALQTEVATRASRSRKVQDVCGDSRERPKGGPRPRRQPL